VAYCDPQDLIHRFGQAELAQLAPADPGPIDMSRAQQACDDASDLADGYLRARYSLPLSTTPKVLGKLCCDIARAELHHGGDRQPTDQVVKARDAAIAFLKDVASGKADLGLGPSGADPVQDAAVRRSAGTRGLSDDDLAGYRFGDRA